MRIMVLISIVGKSGLDVCILVDCLRNEIRKQCKDLLGAPKLRFTFLNYDFSAANQNTKPDVLGVASLNGSLNLTQKAPRCLRGCFPLTCEFVQAIENNQQIAFRELWVEWIVEQNAFVTDKPAALLNQI